MNDEVEAEEQPTNRRGLIVVLLILWLVTSVALGVVGWNAYFGESKKTQNFAEQVDAACQSGDLKSFPRRYRTVLCENARKVIEENDPELQDDEVQDTEIQDPENQDPEIQDSENQEREVQEPEDQEAEIQDPELGDDEVQDGEIDDPDPDDPENQDPEIDDPDPASPYDFVFIFTVPGDGLLVPDRTYTVMCNSGSGNCTVQES